MKIIFILIALMFSSSVLTDDYNPYSAENFYRNSGPSLNERIANKNAARRELYRQQNIDFHIFEQRQNNTPTYNSRDYNAEAKQREAGDAIYRQERRQKYGINY